MPITWTDIQQLYDQTLTELVLAFPLDDWRVKPQKIALTQHKTKYGMADHKGVVYINQAFVDSEAHQLLAATLRHELAHLYVGLHHGHDQQFKTLAKAFKSHFGRHLATEKKSIHNAIGYKYRLYATLKDDGEILLRKVHRKHSKYTTYKPSFFKYLSVKGQKVLSFRYEAL